MMSETRRYGSGRWVTPALIAGMIILVWVNHTLLAHWPELWRALSNSDSAIPSRAAILHWDVARLIIGVVLIPGSGVLLWWAAIRGRPLRTWGPKTIVAFVVGLVSLAFHLQWMYDWGSERHLELPRTFVRAITFLSLNAPLYLAAIGTVVLLRRLWLFYQRRERHA
jgi:hypothetical protein